MLLVTLLLKFGGIAMFVRAIVDANHDRPFAMLLIMGIGCFILSFVCWGGFFTLQPNEARVLILFGAYKGSIRKSGFHWTNPFYAKKKISLRKRNLNGERAKVNDKRGNPIEIAAVVVWKVRPPFLSP